MKRVGVWVDGVVQGVGFRWWVQSTARRLALTGTVRNVWDGRVEVHAQGPDAAVDELVRLIGDDHPGVRRPGLVDTAEVHDEPLIAGETSFDVR